MSEQLEKYKKLLKRKREVEDSLVSMKAVFESKTKEFEQLRKEVMEKYGVSSLEQLKALRTQREQEMEQVIKALEAEAGVAI